MVVGFVFCFAFVLCFELCGSSFFESLNEIYDIDELSSPLWNNEPVTVGLPRLSDNGDIVGDYRFASKIKITPIRRAVPKPVVMNHLQLKDKK